MVKRPIAIGNRNYDKVGDANIFYTAMLRRYSIGQVVSKADAVELLALLQRHDELDEKIGRGIAHFEVASAPDGHPGKCFWIVRTDGTRIDFSIKHCLAGC
ncbi:MAG: DCL family protein [Rhodopseudomonas sp.]|uniref:DCL family protein n=1 Tax=Rhodopseudomonas sp. TaxID=1078 RepID=UPI0039E45C9C